MRAPHPCWHARSKSHLHLHLLSPYDPIATPHLIQFINASGRMRANRQIDDTTPVYRKSPVSTPPPCINISHLPTHSVSPPSPAYTESSTGISQSAQRSPFQPPASPRIRITGGGILSSASRNVNDYTTQITTIFAIRNCILISYGVVLYSSISSTHL